MGFVLLGGELLVSVVGLALMIQGFLGGSAYQGGRTDGRSADPDGPGVEVHPERDRVRLAIMGIGLMALAVVISSVVDH